MRSRTICIIFLFLSISGLVVLTAAETAEAMTWSVQLAALVGGPSQMLQGVKITASNYGYPTFTCPTTPCTMVLPEGQWTFTAPMSATVSGVKYSFVRWTDNAGRLLSTSNTFTYGIYSGRNFYAIYAQVQTTTTRTTRTTQGYTTTRSSANLYTVYLILKSYLPVAGWKIYLDNKYVGQTDSQGRLTITNVTSGLHKFTLKGIWGTYYSTYYVNCNVQLTLTLR